MKDRHLYVVILAGGSGTRFWPVSRKKNPKQFLNILSNNTLLDLTIVRILPLVFPSHIFVVTNRKYKKQTQKVTRKLRIPDKNILLEPSGKNTAPAICWAASHINRSDPSAVMVTLPSDHIILNEIKFLGVVRKAVALAKKNHLVTFGITPTRPDTGFGYIKAKAEKDGRSTLLRVDRFIEKPSLKRAEKFVKEKKMYWNSGMFVWKTEMILDEFKVHQKKIYSLIGQDPKASKVAQNWKLLPNISVDHAILEKSDSSVVVESKNLGWSDLGSWQSVLETLKTDKNGNLFLGDVINVDCKNCLVYGKNRVISTIGLEDCIIVDTKDALLICKKDRSQDVKKLVGLLEKRYPELL